MKIRRNHIRKRYRFNVNRKNLNKSKTKIPKIKCPEVKQFYEDKKMPSKNYYDMGLATDPNKSIPLPNYKKDRLKMVRIINGFIEEDVEEKPLVRPRRKQFVVDILEKEANELRKSKLRLPKGLVAQLSYFIDKYQFNYKAMVNDRKNFDQWTWKQFRMKIRKFKSIEEQFNEFLKTRNLSAETLDWEEYDSESEWK